MKTVKEIWEIYPPFFGRNVWTSKKVNYEPYIGVGKGWYSIVADVIKVIKKECELHGIDVYATQIKEKFGGLRIYVNNGTDEIYNAIDKAEDLSYETCEDCGSKENVTSEGRWIRTLCNKCRKGD